MKTQMTIYFGLTGGLGLEVHGLQGHELSVHAVVVQRTKALVIRSPFVTGSFVVMSR